MNGRQAFITFVKDEQQELIYLHFNAIRKFDKVSPVIYISERAVATPTGSINLHGVSIQNKGIDGLLTLISTYKAIHEQQHISTFIHSTVSTAIRQPFTTEKKYNFIGFMNNINCSFNNSFYIFSASLLHKVIDMVKSKLYFDLYSRDTSEVFLFLLNQVTNEDDKLILQLVMQNGLSAVGSFFNSSLFSNSEQLLRVILFVECADFQFLGNYLQARLNLNEAIKRAMRFVLKSWKLKPEK